MPHLRCSAPCFRLAAACALAVAVRLPAQTVRVANLQPSEEEVSAQPDRRVLILFDADALEEYGGVEKLRFRLLWDVTPPPQPRPPDRSAAPPPPPCMVVPTRVVRPRETSDGEVDFGPLFTVADLRVNGERLQETVFYLVAEVEGVPGNSLLVHPEDLRRYVNTGVRLILQPLPGRASVQQIRTIILRQRQLGEITPTPRQCWSVVKAPPA